MGDRMAGMTMKHAVRALLLGAAVIGLLACGSSVTSGRYFDTTHARDVQRGHDRATMLAWFGQPWQTTALDGQQTGCVERWLYKYGAIERNAWTGRAGATAHAYALAIDFDANGTVCNTAYDEQ